VEIMVALFAPWLRDAAVREDLVQFVRDPKGFAGCESTTRYGDRILAAR
jgi:hypothetical protein